MLVNFFFIGPSKTASTWLYLSLAEHPQFNVSPGKDIYFFDRFFNYGVDWYHRQFEEPTPQQWTGDFSHDYILSEKALTRIKQYNPDARLLVCLRDPFARTESGIRFLQRNGYGYGGIENLVVKHPELIEGSLYARNLERVYRHFDRDNVLLLEYQQLQNDSRLFLEQVYRFFDVEYFAPSVAEKVVNKSSAPRSRVIAYWVKRLALLARAIGLGSMVGRIKMQPVVARLLYKQSSDVYSLSENDREYLASFFNPDIDKLSALTGKDFSGWKYE
ncbi:sulfotransferase [Marinobacteraceae bacterium S3BR75-40.1]